MPECCKIVSMLSLHSENGQKCNPSDVNGCSQWHFKAVSLLYDVCKAPNNADKQIHATTLLALRSLVTPVRPQLGTLLSLRNQYTTGRER